MFSKATYAEAILPFTVFEPTKEEMDACSIDIEAHGRIGETYKFYYAAIGFKAKDYDELIEILKSAEDKSVKIIAKIKNGKVKSFKIDFLYLAEKFQHKGFEKGEIYGYGINEIGSS